MYVHTHFVSMPRCIDVCRDSNFIAMRSKYGYTKSDCKRQRQREEPATEVYEHEAENLIAEISHRFRHMRYTFVYIDTHVAFDGSSKGKRLNTDLAWSPLFPVSPHSVTMIFCLTRLAYPLASAAPLCVAACANVSVKCDDKATLSVTRGPLSFSRREAWPALDAGLKIFERQSEHSGDELLRRIIAHAPTECNVPQPTCTERGSFVEVSAATVRGVLCHAVLCNARDAIAEGTLGESVSKPSSRCASVDRKSGGGLVFDEWLRDQKTERAAEKAACMMHYLHAATSPGFDGERKIRFELCSASDRKISETWPSVRVHTGEFTERDRDTTFVNFANAVFLYGKMTPSHHGVSVEEFLQVEYPELLIGFLYFGLLGDKEAVVAEGFRRFSEHTGYMKSFKCAGASSDPRTFRVLTMDARNYNPDLERAPDDPEHGQKVNYAMQFSAANVLRDVQKAAAAFEDCEHVSTGKWGCGIFKGNVYLKFLEQMLSASQAGVKELSFTTYHQEEEAARCTELLAALLQSGIEPKDLSSFLFSLCEKNSMSEESADSRFLSIVLEWLANYPRGKKRPFPAH